MAKVLLINPPWYILQGSGFPEIPVGLSYIASFLKKRGHEAKVFNADFGSPKYVSYKTLYENYPAYLARLNDTEGNIWQGIIKEVKEYRPDIVGITLKTGAYRSACNVARLIKGYSPEIVVAVGGPHAAILPKETAAEESFDYLVKGEGEITFSELAECIERGRSAQGVKGLAYSENGKIIDNPARPFIDDLDSLPFPERENHLYKERYPQDGFSLIITGRGCPYNCAFCASEKIWKRKVRFRSPSNVAAEVITVYERYGSRHFKFRDDTFTFDKERALEICDRLIRERLPITWQCDTRADCLDEELVAKMHRAGCIGASIGIESGSERILKLINKGETKENLKNGVGLLRRFGINVGAFIMTGFPTETREEMEETIRFTKGLSPNHIILSIVTPYPGTRIYEEGLAMGLLSKTGSWEDWFHQSPEMGLVNDKETFREVTQRHLEEIESYNRSMWRKLAKLPLQILRNPSVGVRKLRRICRA